MVMVVMVVVMVRSVLVPALAFLSRTDPLLLRHSYFDFNVLILSTATTTRERETHFERTAIMSFFLQGNFKNNGRRS